MNILLTGANGFIGSRLLVQLLHENIRTLGRTAVERSPCHSMIDIANASDFTACLQGVECIVHSAARAHIMKDEVVDSLAEYRRINVDGTLSLARQAANAGVKRFIFISSIKVNGEQTPLGKPFTPDDTPAPEDAYGISKWEAEQGLQEIASSTGMEVVIIRPPLVYGPGVKGNFNSMINVVKKSIPIPFGAISNKRSLVGVDNLIDLILTCINQPDAANQIFLVSDGRDLSTTELLQGVARAMGRPSRLIPIPVSVLSLCASLIGKRVVAQRLLDSLQVDISKNREILGWEPPVSVEDGLRRCFESQKVKV